MKILILSPYFAPYTGVGALRMNSLAAYLQQSGDNVTVLKLTDAAYEKELTAGAPLPGILCEEFTFPSNGGEPGKDIYAVIDRVCRAGAFDCCLASFGPYYTVRPAIYIQKHYHIPLVVDYRDLWLYEPRPITSLRMFLGKARQIFMERRTEKAMLNACAFFVTCTPGNLQIMRKHYPFLKERSACVFNGYGLPEKGCCRSHPDDSEIRIFVLGKLAYYSPHGAETFFQAVSNLIKKGCPIQVIHAGAAEPLDSIFSRTGFPKERYQGLGPLPYEDALAAAESAHICVAVISYAIGLGTKIFDYIYLNKPIVAYAPKHSEFEAVLSEAENAYVCQTSERMEAAIEKIVAEKRYTLTGDPLYRLQFSRQTQNQKFRDLLKKAKELSTSCAQSDSSPS